VIAVEYDNDFLHPKFWIVRGGIMDLQAIWFFLWGLLWAVYFMTDGFDFGVGTLLPFLGKTDEEKQTMIAAIGPLWDGNEVWLISAGGVTFAAFPLVYSVMFSTLYSALMLILFTLIMRGVSFEFRNKVGDPRWKRLWDTCIFHRQPGAGPAFRRGLRQYLPGDSL
jgi:cytochrome d ubiquinol oxidase subunit II